MFGDLFGKKAVPEKKSASKKTKKKSESSAKTRAKESDSRTLLSAEAIDAEDDPMALMRQKKAQAEKKSVKPPKKVKEPSTTRRQLESDSRTQLSETTDGLPDDALEAMRQMKQKAKPEFV